MTPITMRAVQAYSNAGSIASGGGLDPRTGAAPDFAQMVKGAASDAVSTMQAGEKASIGAVGGSGNLTEVVTAVSNAEATLQTVVAVRDRVISAYQDILKMPI